MKYAAELTADLWRDEQGQDMVEYALIAGFLGLAAMVSLGDVKGSIESLFGKIKTKLDAAP